MIALALLGSSLLLQASRRRVQDRGARAGAPPPSEEARAGRGPQLTA